MSFQLWFSSNEAKQLTIIFSLHWMKMELNSKRMQRDARALLAKLSTLRKEAESLAAVDLRLKTKRQIVHGQSMNLQKTSSPAPRTPKTRPNRPLSGCGHRSNTSSTKKTRKRWSPKTGIQFGLMETKEKNTIGKNIIPLGAICTF